MKRPTFVAFPYEKTKSINYGTGDYEKEEVKILVAEGELNLSDVIDAIIEVNGITGVGLITLGEELDKYCRGKINKNVNFD